MNPEKKIKSLVAIVVFLLLSNIAMIVFFMVLGNNPRRPNHGREEVTNLLKKEVGFSPAQIAQYDSLRNEHFKKARPLFDSIKITKENFYNLLFKDSVSDAELGNAADKIGESQKILDMQMFQHLKNERNLCTPDQLPKFDSVIKTIVSKMTGGFRKSHNGPPQK
ncbi:MAG: periplasmic heavy metal sensor [Chitinophagaceae bacterium]|nr:periplasmic heavy metal sensor [Chitinophagaceae bacterium]